jgi:hypothetical protein
VAKNGVKSGGGNISVSVKYQASGGEKRIGMKAAENEMAKM